MTSLARCGNSTQEESVNVTTEVPIGRASARGVGLALHDVTHRFGQTTAVDAVSLAVEPGEIVALLGPSGCGKTTLLRIIAGLLRQSAGHVAIGGEVVDDLPPNERGAGIVFQNYALFPHMTVTANVSYGLRARGRPRAATAERVARMLELVRMQAFARRLPRELSGGQQQRVALARTLAVSPRVLLLDEPFGALDKNLRLDMQIEVKRLQRELDITTIMVTHDQEEALSLADRVAVMNHGRVEQFARPDEIYDYPASLFVATFVGTTSLLRGRLVTRALGAGLETAAGELPLAGAPAGVVGPVVVAVRPEHFRFVDAADRGLDATIELVLPLGPLVVYDVLLTDGTALKVTAARGVGATAHGPGAKVRIGLAPGVPASVFADGQS
jgi:putative spermidine/putrescine transport system ATP-binding protein